MRWGTPGLLGLALMLPGLEGWAADRDLQPLWTVTGVAAVSASRDGSTLLLLFSTGTMTLRDALGPLGVVPKPEYRRELRDATGTVLKRWSGPAGKLTGDGERLLTPKGIETLEGDLLTKINMYQITEFNMPVISPLGTRVAYTNGIDVDRPHLSVFHGLTGRQLYHWREETSTGDTIIATFQDETHLLTFRRGWLRCLNVDTQHVEWETEVEKGLGPNTENSKLVVAQDGRILLSVGATYCLDALGKLLWKRPLSIVQDGRPLGGGWPAAFALSGRYALVQTFASPMVIALLDLTREATLWVRIPQPDFPTPQTMPQSSDLGKWIEKHGRIDEWGLAFDSKERGVIVLHKIITIDKSHVFGFIESSKVLAIDNGGTVLWESATVGGRAAVTIPPRGQQLLWLGGERLEVYALDQIFASPSPSKP